MADVVVGEKQATPLFEHCGRAGRGGREPRRGARGPGPAPAARSNGRQLQQRRRHDDMTTTERSPDEKKGERATQKPDSPRTTPLRQGLGAGEIAVAIAMPSSTPPSGGQPPCWPGGGCIT